MLQMTVLVMLSWRWLDLEQVLAPVPFLREWRCIHRGPPRDGGWAVIGGAVSRRVERQSSGLWGLGAERPAPQGGLMDERRWRARRSAYRRVLLLKPGSTRLKGGKGKPLPLGVTVRSTPAAAVHPQGPPTLDPSDVLERPCTVGGGGVPPPGPPSLPPSSPSNVWG